MRILDINGKEIVANDRVIFTFNSDLCEGKILSFSGRYAPTAQIAIDNGQTVKKLKLSTCTDRRSVTTVKGEEFFKTRRMRLLVSHQTALEAVKNSPQEETQIGEKNSQEDLELTCLPCNGSGLEDAGPRAAWKGQCFHYRCNSCGSPGQ